MRIWNPECECLPRDDIEQLQLERLQTTLQRVNKNVPFYRNLFLSKGISPDRIRSLKDLVRMPFTRKSDLRDNYPYGLFAVPLREVIRIHASSGTTGKPTVVGYTRRDIHTWSELVARFMTAAGITEDDVVQVSFGYGLFTGGFGLHYGTEKIGASVIPMSSGNTEKQIMIMQDFRPTALVCTPSYALHLAEKIQEMNIDPNSLSLRKGLFGAEPWSENMRLEIEERLRIDATDNYGLSEVIGPGVAGECLEKKGMHIPEDHFIPEIIDPLTGEVLPLGEEGELVVTTITKEALPLIRYRTGDITRLDPLPCSCGRTTIRMTKVHGRSDDMMIIRGVNVFPSQIEHVLMEVEGVEPHYQLIIDRKHQLDELEIQVEVSPKIFFDEMKKQKAIVDEIKHKIQTVLGLYAEVRLVEPKAVERSTGKAVRIIDKRKI